MTGELKPGGPEVVAFLVKHPKHDAHRLCFVPAPGDAVEALTPAEPAEARVREAERKAELYDHMKAVAEANGFQSLTEAIARATAAEAQLARAVEGLERIREGAHETSFAFSTARQTLAALQQGTQDQ